MKSKLGAVLAVFVAVLFGGVAFADPVGEQIGRNSWRIYGTNRYETAVAISRNAGWDHNNAVTVYIASGQQFPDALAMSASAGDGPLLLVDRDSVPAIVVEEVKGLAPCQIVAVGGPAVISTAVIQQLDAYTDGANGAMPNPKCATG